MLVVDPQHLTVRGDELGRQQVVDREAVLSHHEADSTAEGQSTDPDRARVAEADPEAVRRCRTGDLTGGQARLGPGNAPDRIELECPQQREVEHDSALADAVAGGALAPAAHGDLEPALARERDDVGDLVRVDRPHDHLRLAVDRREEPRGRRRTRRRSERSPALRARREAASTGCWIVWSPSSRSM